LEDAIEKQDTALIERAVRRINLLRSIQVSIGGIPLLYVGDEWGMLNDYTYLTDPMKANDSRWIHRSRKRWEAREDLTEQDTLEWRFFHEMVKLFNLRKKLPSFQNGGMEVIHTGNPHLFGYIRTLNNQKILIVNNFAEALQKMEAAHLRACGVKGDVINLLTDEVLPENNDLILDDHRFVWLDISKFTKGVVK
jgi:amylosucrase